MPIGRDSFRPQRKFTSPWGFHCSPSSTDKPNVTVNTRQNYSPGTEFTYSRDSENGVRVVLILTSHNGIGPKSRFLLTISSSDKVGIKLSFDDNVRKAVNSNYPAVDNSLSTAKYHFRSRESGRNVDIFTVYNVENSLSATIMRLSAWNCDEMSIIHFLYVARKEFHFVRRNCQF